MAWFGSGGDNDAARGGGGGGAKGTGGPASSRNNIPADLRNASEGPAAAASARLDTTRVSSSIPMGGFTPGHQRGGGADGDVGDGGRRWQYPSPLMFYNALKRKGFDPDERDMDTCVRRAPRAAAAAT